MRMYRSIAYTAVLVLCACGGGASLGPGGVSPGADPTPSVPPAAASGTPASASPGPTGPPTHGPGSAPTAAPTGGSSATPTATAVPTTSTSAAPTASAAGAASVPFPSVTDSDAFYAQPSPFPGGVAPGTILASRSVTYAPVGGAAMPNQAYQLRFVSRDTNGDLIAAQAVVVEPTTRAIGVEPLEAVYYAEDSLGPQCAPSHSVMGSTTNSVEQSEASAALQGLAMGWTLVYPDYEGPQSEYGAGLQSGRISLDAIRAAEHFAPLGLGAATPVVMTGYSGGGFPAAWSATIRSTYAPELHVVGIASGGTPASPEGIVQNIDTNQVSNAAFFNLIFSAVEGTNRAYPSLLAGTLNAKGIAAAKSLASGCDGQTTDGSAAPSGTLPDYTTNADPVHDPAAEALYPAITLPQSGQAPKENVFVYHSQVDELIPIAGADAMVSGWCAAGSPIEYYRGATGDHVAFEATTATLVYAYLASRIKGAATVVPPGTTTCNI